MRFLKVLRGSLTAFLSSVEAQRTMAARVARHGGALCTPLTPMQLLMELLA